MEFTAAKDARDFSDAPSSKKSTIDRVLKISNAQFSESTAIDVNTAVSKNAWPRE